MYGVAGKYVTALEREWAELIGNEQFQQLKHLLGALWDAYRPIEEEVTGHKP